MPYQLQLLTVTLPWYHELMATASSKPAAEIWVYLCTPESSGTSLSRRPWPASPQRCSRPSQPQLPVLTQVALLFLASDAMPAEPLWAAFIASAVELSALVRGLSHRPRQPASLPPISQQYFAADCRGRMLARPREPFLGELCRQDMHVMHAHSCYSLMPDSPTWRCIGTNFSGRAWGAGPTYRSNAKDSSCVPSGQVGRRRFFPSAKRPE